MLSIKKEEDNKDFVKGDEVSDNDAQNSSDSDNDVNWWEQDDLQIAGRGEKRWDTLSHNGVMFAPPYVPHGVPILYDGQVFQMTPEEEEVATMFAVMKEHDYYRNKTFRANFFRSWREILDKRSHPIKRLELCDFENIYQWHLREREKIKSITKEEKKKKQLAAAAEAEPYKYCMWNSCKEEVGRYRVEPPGLFRGRGDHPRMGMLKARVHPEDVTINIGEEAEVPKPPPGHHWASVQHDHTVTWLAMWRDNVTDNFKYVMPAPTSTIKGQSDMLKFEKARHLKHKIEHIRESYTQDFRSKEPVVAQRAVAMYFIDKLALRVGNEKGPDEADTVGCCSLRVEHIKLLPDNIVAFDFLGKDSIRYQNEVTVLPDVHRLLRKFMHKKKPNVCVFDAINTSHLNDHLKSFMDGLTAKVFRTYNASYTLDRWFNAHPLEPYASIADKMAYFNKANTEVAILCNHQKSVSKNFSNQMKVLTGKVSNTRDALAQLEKAREMMKTHSVEEAIKEFFAEQDAKQYDWLEAYGTEEQKNEYDALVAARAVTRVSTKSSRNGTRVSASPARSKATNDRGKSSTHSSRSKNKKKRKTGARSARRVSSVSRTRKSAIKSSMDDENEEDNSAEKNGVSGGRRRGQAARPGKASASKEAPRRKVTKTTTNARRATKRIKAKSTSATSALDEPNSHDTRDDDSGDASSNNNNSSLDEIEGNGKCLIGVKRSRSATHKPVKSEHDCDDTPLSQL